jgi:hypothetical protein
MPVRLLSLIHSKLTHKKVRLRTSHEGSDREQRYSSTLSLTSVVNRGQVVNATTQPLYSWEGDPVPSV